MAERENQFNKEKIDAMAELQRIAQQSIQTDIENVIFFIKNAASNDEFEIQLRARSVPFNILNIDKIKDFLIFSGFDVKRHWRQGVKKDSPEVNGLTSEEDFKGFWYLDISWR